MRLRPEEPSFGGWTVVALSEFLDLMLTSGAGPTRTVLAIDGRSSSGKTSLTARLCGLHPRSAAVHTDDIAWWHSRFGWTDLLVEGILTPFTAGEEISYRPPAWNARDRAGTIEVPTDVSLLVVEGVGSSRRELTTWLDAAVWMQADEDAIDERNARRIAAGETTAGGVTDWMSEEIPFLTEDRPWERATAIVDGTTELAFDQRAEVVIAVS